MELPQEVPVMTLQNATLFPQALLPLYIFEPRYRQMLKESLETHRMFCVAMQKPDRVRETPCKVAGLGLIRVSVKHADGTSHLILQGITRVEFGKAVRTKPYRIQRITPLAAPPTDSLVVDALVEKIHELVARRVQQGGFPVPLPLAKAMSSDNRTALDATVKEVLRYLEKLPSADHVADLVTCAMLPDPAQRQIVLECVDLEPRLKHVVHFLMAEVARHGTSASGSG